MKRDWFYNQFSTVELFAVFEQYCLAWYGEVLPVGGTGRCSIAAALERLDVPLNPGE